MDGGFTIYRNVTIMNNNIRFSDGAGEFNAATSSEKHIQWRMIRVSFV